MEDNEKKEEIQLPVRLPRSPHLRAVLGEFYDIFKNKQWFWRAELVESHPTHMTTTLEIYCKYNPVLEMKEILQFTARHNIALEMVPFSHQG